MGRSASGGPDHQAGHGDPHAGPAPARRGLRRVVALLATLAVVAAVAAGALWWRLDHNVSRISLGGSLAADRPSSPGPEGPMTILVIGSDTRSGQSAGEAPDASTVQGARSDTTLLVHLSADRKSATVVSVPRDSMVPMPPGCDADAPRSSWTVRQVNSAFSEGGAACLVNTLEGDTGIFVDHVVVVDFRGFVGIVDALGGVPVCTPTPIDDPKAHLRLAAGRHVLDGRQALGYVRARYSIGDGSDLGRIGRQQQFLSSLVQEATRSSVLLRPDKLLPLLDAVTRSVTTDTGLGIGQMRDIATSVARIGIGNISFVTVPVEPYPADPNRVRWTSAASTLWRDVREDHPLTPSPTPSTTPSQTTPSATPTPLTVAPSEVSVVVVNATGVTGLAAQDADALRVQGFAVAGLASSDTRPDGVTVRYAPGRLDAARTVAAAFPGSRLEESTSAGTDVTVTLGAGARPVVAVPNRTGTDPVPAPTVSAPAPTPTPSLASRTAAQDICS